MIQILLFRYVCMSRDKDFTVPAVVAPQELNPGSGNLLDRSLGFRSSFPTSLLFQRLPVYGSAAGTELALRFCPTSSRDVAVRP